MKIKYLVTGSMIVLALASGAQAADIVRRQPVVAAYPVFTWTGPYAGLNIGYSNQTHKVNAAQQKSDDVNKMEELVPAKKPEGQVSNVSEGILDPDQPTVADNQKDAAGNFGLVGGFLGYGFDFAGFVAAVELGVDYYAIGAAKYNPNANLDVKLSRSWTGDLRARLGYGFDRALAFISGGATYNSKLSSSNDAVKADDARFGYTLGAGLDYAITDNSFVRLEYRYNGITGQAADTAKGQADVTGLTAHEVRLGIAAKY